MLGCAPGNSRVPRPSTGWATRRLRSPLTKRNCLRRILLKLCSSQLFRVFRVPLAWPVFAEHTQPLVLLLSFVFRLHTRYERRESLCIKIATLLQTFSQQSRPKRSNTIFVLQCQDNKQRAKRINHGLWLRNTETDWQRTRCSAVIGGDRRCSAVLDCLT